jgi:exopolyphosphatase / guanosine-5'-triphosphate,3'-diphosphate pyrophosphatase
VSPPAAEPGLRFAAVDVGSNALRLLFTQVLENGGEPCFRKVSLIRMPLRLGTEVFASGRLTKPTVKRLLQSLEGFRLLIDAWKPLAWRACATSALRDAANRETILDLALREARCKLSVLSGRREAQLLLNNQPSDWHPQDRNYLYIDVGGGSTELTLLKGGKAVATRSAPLGSVRLLTGSVPQRHWDEAGAWLREACGGCAPLCVGSGGNINKLKSLLGLRQNQPIGRDQIAAELARVEPLSVEERIRRLGLRPDRADVYPHALRIYLHCMSAAGAEEMVVPRSGLADALVRELWLDWKRKQ